MTAPIAPSARRLVLLALLAATLASCGDKEASALRSLAARGYSLSIAEYHRAAAAGDVPALRDFLQSGTAVDVRDSKGETALIAAVSEGKADAVKYLIENGASPGSLNAEGHTSVFIAASKGREAALSVLLEAGAMIEPSAKGVSALELAAAHGHSGVVALLATRERSSLDAALIAAAGHGDVATLDILLQRGASPFSQDAAGNTPLHAASQAGHGDAVKLLLSSGAWRFASNHEGRLALDLARNAEIAKLLTADPAPEELELDSAPADAPRQPASDAAAALREVPSAIPLTEANASLHLQRRLPSIHGAIVDHRLSSSGFPAKPEERLHLRTVRPRQLPVLLESATDAGAVFRHLQQSGPLIEAALGAFIGDTGLVLERVELRPEPGTKLPHSWFPRVILREAATENRFLAQPLLPVRHGGLTSVMIVPNAEEVFEARAGDVFRFAGEGEVEVRVNAIAPNKVTFEQGAKQWELRL
jgi:ankyrin repeat protein